LAFDLAVNVLDRLDLLLLVGLEDLDFDCLVGELERLAFFVEEPLLLLALFVGERLVSVFTRVSFLTPSALMVKGRRWFTTWMPAACSKNLALFYYVLD
jgi:hypothetical protein